MALYPSGKGGVCKTPIGQFDSDKGLHTFVVQRMNWGLLSPEYASSSLVEGANLAEAQRKCKSFLRTGVWVRVPCARPMVIEAKQVAAPGCDPG
jgi:hypothetical protein